MTQTLTTEELRERIGHLKERLHGMKQHKYPDDCPNAKAYIESLKAERQQDIALLEELLANREAQPVVWGSPKTVGQLIGQLQTLDPAMETTALLRMPDDFQDGNAVKQVPITISFEKLNGHWLAPYKGEGRKVLAFWAKTDHREETERGELFTAPPAPAVKEFGARRCCKDKKCNAPIVGYSVDGLCEDCYMEMSKRLAPVVNPEFTGATAVPDFKKLARELVENLVDCGGVDDSSIKQYLKWTEKTCSSAMLAQPVRRGCTVVPLGWIDCAFRVPDTDGNYWGWWSESKRQGPVWFIKSDVQAQFQSREITHWMPLPAAPEGGNEK